MRQPSRSERFSRFAIKGFAIPARVIWWGLSSLGETYNLLFGRWLDPWLHKRRDKEFSAELERRLGRLFARHPARPIPNSRSDYEMKRLFDYSVASFETEDLLLRFVKVRLEYSA